MSRKHFLGILLFLLTTWVVQAQETERQYLSGTGLGNTVTWQFRVSEGRNSGRWSKIEVPSQWELQGFGEYTYGRWYKKPGVKNPSMEEGTYKRSFRVPRNWQGQNIRLWFDGVMTDTEVLVNGQSAGPVHQGGFYRFSYDVTELLKYGNSNQIEVRVKKHSDNRTVNAAERKADWWLFGGIYRPVWLEAKPATHIERLAVDAQADGTLKLDVYLKGVTEEGYLGIEVEPLQKRIHCSKKRQSYLFNLRKAHLRCTPQAVGKIFARGLRNLPTFINLECICVIRIRIHVTLWIPASVSAPLISVPATGST